MKKSEDKKVEEGGVDELSETRMWNLLMELTKTDYWEAAKKYVRLRDRMVTNSLVSIDPFKEPTTMARNQGVRIGLFDLEQAVKVKLDERVDAEKAANPSK